MAGSRAAVIKPAIIGFDEGKSLDFAGVHGLLKIDGVDAGERFALAYFPFIPPHVLAAPLHRHHREDEYTWVVEGMLGVQLGEEVVTAQAGMLVIKPRGQWHTFWNPADTPCRTIEIVSPAGFQRYFSEVATLGGDPNRVAELNAKYSLDMDFESVPVLCKRFNLRFPA